MQGNNQCRVFSLSSSPSYAEVKVKVAVHLGRYEYELTSQVEVITRSSIERRRVYGF